MSNQTVVKILPCKIQAHYAEESQDLQVFMSFAKKLSEKEYQKLHQYILCRDFLGDVLYSEQESKGINIYSFVWGQDDRKIDRDKTRFALKHDDVEAFKKNLLILNEIEKQNKLDPTIYYLSEEPNVILTEGDPRWQSSIFLISLYTYLLKCLYYKIKDKQAWIENIIEQGTKESRYATKRGKLLPLMLDNLERFGFDKESEKVKVHGFDKDPGMGTVHNNTGWVNSKTNYYAEVLKELQAAA